MAAIIFSLNSFKKPNPNTTLNDFQSLGCYQYDTKYGSIRALGVCGATKICAQRTSQSDCETTSPVAGYCAWSVDPNGNGTCGPGQSLLNAPSCAVTCNTNTDCHNVASIACDPQTNPCLVGYCQNGFCQGGQTCDPTSKTCTPSPSFDPAYPINTQMSEGKLGFCLGGVPPTICSGASSICNTTGDNNGCCDACDANDPDCSNPGGTITKPSCMCTGSNWVTIPICGGSASMVTNLAYMQAFKSQWAPTPTPLVVTILTGIGVLMMLVTLVWYVLYLIKHGKK